MSAQTNPKGETLKMEKLLTVKEAAEILHVHPVTLRRWAMEGKIASVKMGKARRFQLSDLNSFVATHAKPVKETTK